MAESTLKSYDPMAYYVNNIEDLDQDVCRAHLNNDKDKEKQLINQGRTNFDVYICVTKSPHAFVLCAPVGNPDDPFADMLKDDVNQIPHLTLCWKFDLCFENVSQKTYRIGKEFKLFKDIERLIKYSYYIGRFEDTAHKALQFAAIRAAPHRYNALLNDCVEFAKEFCVCLLSYCSNWKTLEDEVQSKIKKASATGLSIERLSRNVRSSGLLGNSFLAGVDFSSFAGQLGNRGVAFVVLFFLVVVFVYPVLVAFLVVYLVK